MPQVARNGLGAGLLAITLAVLGLAAGPAGAVADEAHTGVIVETDDVCVIFPNQFGFPDLAEVRHPQIVRYRILAGTLASGSIVLWLPGRDPFLVHRLIVKPAPLLPDHCAIPLDWPD